MFIILKKLFSLLISLLSATNTIACSAFGSITDRGTVIGKNRDYMYSVQRFERQAPLKQFYNWFGNPYQHHNSFYALSSKNDVKFGINNAGLSAISEDPVFPIDASSYRRYMQPYSGYSEGMVLYGVLQNFSNLEELMPYIDQIFSLAAPSFYQFSDKHSILTVEVAYGESDDSPSRRYSYTLLNASGDYFAHTNTYLSPEFQTLNDLSTNKDSIRGSNYRLSKITKYIQAAGNDFSQAINWYLDTRSEAGSSDNPKFCQNTSLFRSHLKTLRSVDQNTDSDTDYGTVSSFVVEHQAEKTLVHLRILQSIDTLENEDQTIVYKDLSISLKQLFNGSQLNFSLHSMIRPAPIAGVCYEAQRSDLSQQRTLS